MDNVWRSTRLIYRGVNDDDDEFFAALNNDSSTFMGVEAALASPPGSKEIKRFRQMIQDNPEAHINAIVCLPPQLRGVQTSEIVGASDNDVSTTTATPLKPVPIGVVSLFNGGPPSMVHHRQCEVGVRFLKAYQNKGYGTEALEWLICWGFRHANIHRINIGAFSHNKRAIRVYEKLGFVLEGRRRDMFWFDGAYHDLIEFGMLEHEWRRTYNHI